MRSPWVLVGIGLLVAWSPGCGSDANSGNGGAGGTETDAASGGAAGVSGTAGQGGSDASSGGSAGADAGAGAGGGGVAGAGGGDGGLADAAEDGGIADAAGDADGAGGDADAADGEAGVPLPGLGTITGDCGPIDPTEILSPSPFTFETALDFGTTAFDYNALSLGGKQVHDTPNLGGGSLYSEVFSYEVLYRCELAQLLKTEVAIEYQDVGGKKTDFLVAIDGYKVGVSVTRGFAFPPGSTFSVNAAQSLLQGKLNDVLLSTQNVKPVDAWEKQILHVIAYNDQHRDALFQAYPSLPSATRADTLVMVTVTHGADDFIY